VFIRVDSSNGVPVYEQIVRQVKFAIADGVVAAGDLLPSVRELARELAINPNTVARAFRELESEGLMETRRGLGAFIVDSQSAIERERERLAMQALDAFSEQIARLGPNAALKSRILNRLTEELQ